jgi:hypothetical protein
MEVTYLNNNLERLYIYISIIMITDKKTGCCFCDKEIDARFIMCRDCVKLQYEDDELKSDKEFDVINVVFDPE